MGVIYFGPLGTVSSQQPLFSLLPGRLPRPIHLSAQTTKTA